MKQPKFFYRYTITNSLGTSISAPFNEGDFTLDLTQNDENLYSYSKNFPAKLILRGADYQSLLTIETSTNRCELMTIVIERPCGAGWVPWFSGTFILNDANWDLYKCEVQLKIQKNDPEDCLDENKSAEVNLFDFATNRQAVTLYDSTVIIETAEYRQTTAGNCTTGEYWAGPGTPAAGGWVAHFHQHITTRNSFNIRTCAKLTKWARQKLTLPTADPSPGAEWILISDTGGNKTWAKPVALYDCVEETIPPNSIIVNGFKKECQILGLNATLTELDNGMKLADILQGFADEFCPGLTVKSNFFQINPDTVTNINYVTGLPTTVSNLIVYQKSDVKRPAVSGNATKALTTWDKITTQLVEMFNIRWRVSGAELRIEHISFFNKNAGFDLTTPRYAKYVRGKAEYSYKSEQIPPYEEFKFMEASPGDFTGVPIYYSGGCVTKDKKASPKTHAADLVTTDVELVMANPDPKSEIVDDKGFVIIAADANNKILSEPGILQTGTRLNNVLSWAHLHRDYHKHYRLLKTGTLNNLPTTFASVKPFKKGVAITIELCCDDVFNPDDTVTTELGIGVVEKATYRFKDETVTLDLLYVTDEDLNAPPLAVNDAFTIENTAAIDLDVILNDNAGSGTTITGITIVTPPGSGTATVIAGPKIRFTPSPGFTGLVNLTYNITNDLGLVSNTALVAITVTAANDGSVTANNDAYTALEDTTLDGSATSVLVNDVNSGAGVMQVGTPGTYPTTEGGTITIDALGFFSYAPPAGFTGTDTFTYTATNGTGSDTGTITFTVNPHTFTVLDKAYSVKTGLGIGESGPGTTPVGFLIGHTNTRTGTTAAVTNPGNYTLANGGLLSVQANGGFTYANTTGYIGTETFNYNATNGSETDSGTVTFTVTP